MITIYIKGGLGNQLFQISCALGLSYKTNKKLIIGENLISNNNHQHNNKNITINTLKKLFPDLNIVDNLDISNYFQYNENSCEVFKYTNIYNEIIAKIDKIDNENILLQGYFISEKYFERSLKCCIESTLGTYKYKELTNNFENTYFIHIRLGDYVNHYLYTINLIDYYNYCINKIKSQNPLAQFIICTNEYGSNLDNYINKFPKNKNINYIIQDENNDAVDTLYIMKNCKGGICSNSTLSWCGAYFQQFENDNKNVLEINHTIEKQNTINNKDYIFMPYPWVNFVNGFNNDTIKDVYPEWSQIYDTINNKIM